ncbi:MAG: dihydrolipoamide acetyltransferase family protein [Planctomycetota bacterium]
MATPVILPKQGNSVETCLIQEWKKTPGDTVEQDEVLLEVETDKAVVEVVAPCSGTLLETFVEVDEDVPVMSTIAAIGEPGEDIADIRPAGEVPPASAEESAGVDPVAAMAEADGHAPPSPAASAPAATASAPAGAPSAATGTGAGSSPRARALAAAHGINVAELDGTGPQGLVIERDVAALSVGRARLSPAAAEALQRGGLVAPERGTGPDGMVLIEDLRQAAATEPISFAAAAPEQGGYEDIKLPNIRRIIAERMRASLSGSAQYTLNASARADALQALRQRFKAGAEALGLPNITIGDMIVFAVSRVLQRFPELNAHFLGEHIRRFTDVNLGVAVDTPRGLMVPVLPQVDRMTLAQISAAFRPLATECQNGSIDPDRLQGGSFTVSNLGALGIESFTPVLNVPEVAILGVGGIQLRPYPDAEDPDAVTFAPTLALSLTCDHQAVDGAPAARFLQALCRALENMDALLAL